MSQVFEYEDNTQPVTEPKKEEVKIDEPTGESSGGEEESNPVEEQARSDGWVPKDEWKGHPDEWVDAREFNYRGELMGRIKSQSAQIRQVVAESNSLKEALGKLAEHNTKIAKREYDRAIRDLKAQKREAERDEEFAVADELDEKIEELKKANDELEGSTKEKESETKKVPEISQENKDLIQQWIGKNQWYTTDEVMNGAADAIMMRYFQENPGDIKGALKHVETKMRQKFPQDFASTPKKAAVTETDGRSSPKGKNKGSKFTKADLNEDQARIGKTFVDNGVYKNIQEYVDDLALMGEIE